MAGLRCPSGPRPGVSLPCTLSGAAPSATRPSSPATGLPNKYVCLASICVLCESLLLSFCLSIPLSVCLSVSPTVVRAYGFQVITTGINQFLSLYNAALIGRLVLTWFPNPPQAIVGPLSTICDPYLNLFRGIIPPLGGTIDLSPILAFVVLDLFTNSAAALPCELSEEDKKGSTVWRGQ